MPPLECPTCGQRVPPKSDDVDSRAFPFCSTRCQLVDLGRWLDGDYRFADRPVEGYRDGRGTDADE